MVANENTVQDFKCIGKPKPNLEVCYRGADLNFGIPGGATWENFRFCILFVEIAYF